MIISTKLNLLLLPLFVSILLSTASKLKIRPGIDTVFYTMLSPLSIPISRLRLYSKSQYLTLINLPGLEKQNRRQKNQIASLISENEYLKQNLSDQKVLDQLIGVFRGVLPVRLVGSAGKFIVSSSSSLADVRPGQPLVSGKILLGTVREVKNNIVTITPLSSDKTPIFPVRTTSGQKGLYQYSANSSQIIDIPSQSPLVLGDMVLTEPGEIFPGSLIIGQVSRLLTVSQEPLQRAEVLLYDTLDHSPENLAIITQP
jgi:cell shape-determining protein MreC